MTMVRCVGCGLEKEFEVRSGGDYFENGFDVIRYKYMLKQLKKLLKKRCGKLKYK